MHRIGRFLDDTSWVYQRTTTKDDVEIRAQYLIQAKIEFAILLIV